LTDLGANWQVSLHVWGKKYLGEGVEFQPKHAIADCGQTVSPMLPPADPFRFFAKLLFTKILDCY